MWYLVLGFLIGLIFGFLVCKRFVIKGVGQMQACNRCDYKLHCLNSQVNYSSGVDDE